MQDTKRTRKQAVPRAGSQSGYHEDVMSPGTAGVLRGGQLAPLNPVYVKPVQPSGSAAATSASHL
jgi:hypothetical protein